MLKLQVCPGLWCPLNISHEAVIKFLFWKSTAPRKHSPSGCAPAGCSFLPSRDSLFHTRVSDSEIKRCIVGSLPYNGTHREVTVVVICCCRNQIKLNWIEMICFLCENKFEFQIITVGQKLEVLHCSHFLHILYESWHLLFRRILQPVLARSVLV